MKKLLIGLVFVLGFFATNQVNAAEADNTQKCANEGSGYCIDLQEPIVGAVSISGANGIELVSNYISLLYKYAASVIGIMCVLVIVVSGVQIVLGGTNQENVSQARGRILQAVLSLALLFLSAAILKTVNPGFFT